MGEVEVCRDGGVHHQEYERGVPKGPVRRVGKSDKVGTKTTFKADPQIFQVTKYSYSTLRKRLQELAFLNRGVRITITDGAPTRVENPSSTRTASASLCGT